MRHDRGAFLGYAYVNPHALICARILSRAWRMHPVDRALLSSGCESALALRERLYGAPLLPLGVRRVGRAAGTGAGPLRRAIVVGRSPPPAWRRCAARSRSRSVRTVLDPARVLVWKNDGGARELEQLPRQVLRRRSATCRPRSCRCSKAALSFSAPLAAAQKTGWFYDQSGNREQWRRLVPPRRACLDVCSYAGAWAIARADARAPRGAVRGCLGDGARSCARRNAAANGVNARESSAATLSKCSTRWCGGVSASMPWCSTRRRSSSARRTLRAGQAAYRKLNQLAHAAARARCAAGELLLLVSSGRRGAAGLIQSAARHSGRFVQVLYIGGQSPDHPVHPAIPETRYLKALFLPRHARMSGRAR